MPDGAGSGEARVGGVPLGQLSTVERLIAAAVVEADHETFRRRQGPFLEFLEATEKAGAVRTLESLARIELGAQGGALVERVTTTRTAKDGTATTTVRERFTPPDWHADGTRIVPYNWAIGSSLAAERGLCQYLQFSQAIKRAGAVRTLESLARIELASQGGALRERVTTTRTSKSGVVNHYGAGTVLCTGLAR